MPDFKPATVEITGRGLIARDRETGHVVMKQLRIPTNRNETWMLRLIDDLGRKGFEAPVELRDGRLVFVP